MVGWEVVRDEQVAVRAPTIGQRPHDRLCLLLHGHPHLRAAHWPTALGAPDVEGDCSRWLPHALSVGQAQPEPRPDTPKRRSRRAEKLPRPGARPGPTRPGRRKLRAVSVSYPAKRGAARLACQA